MMQGLFVQFIKMKWEYFFFLVFILRFSFIYDGDISINNADFRYNSLANVGSRKTSRGVRTHVDVCLTFYKIYDHEKPKREKKM